MELRYTSTSLPIPGRLCRRAAGCLLLLGAAAVFPGCETLSSLEKQRNALLAENAALETRLTMSGRSEAYLVADIGERRLELELRGVILASQPVYAVTMNREARNLLLGPARSGDLETPYRLISNDWLESPGILALRDSARVRPDTTGALKDAIRNSPVTASLEFDRGLTVILEGRRVDSFFRRFLARTGTRLRSLNSGARRGDEARRNAEIRLLLSPADIRSLEPNLKDGSRLVLVP